MINYLANIWIPRSQLSWLHHGNKENQKYADWHFHRGKNGRETQTVQYFN